MRRPFYYLALLGSAVGCRAPQLFSPGQPREPGQPGPPGPAAFHDVGPLGAWTQARGLNDAGDVVGSSSGTQYGDYPILSQNGAIERLEMFAHVADGAMSGRPGRINQHGTIAGVTGTNGLWFVTLWDSTGARTQQTAIGTGQAQWADVVKLNGTGTVLGSWQSAPDRVQAGAAPWLAGRSARPVGARAPSGPTAPARPSGRPGALGWPEPFDLNAGGNAV